MTTKVSPANTFKVRILTLVLDTDDCKVGSLYMPDLLPDHNQPEIHHTASVRVEQHDVRDVEGNLIKPWDMPDKLRPGTFIKAMVQPTCWIYRTADKINKVSANF